MPSNCDVQARNSGLLSLTFVSRNDNHFWSDLLKFSNDSESARCPDGVRRCSKVHFLLESLAEDAEIPDENERRTPIDRLAICCFYN